MRVRRNKQRMHQQPGEVIERVGGESRWQLGDAELKRPHRSHRSNR